MLSHNSSRFIRETVESVLAQTYQNWEIVFLDDSSKDDTISLMMDLKAKARIKDGNGRIVDRIQVGKNVEKRGFSMSVNIALRDARGRWIAFLNPGDIWAPQKLERQIAFMEDHKYGLTYTKYELIDENSKRRGVVVGGKRQINHRDMLRCCWPGYLTVMYDADLFGRLLIPDLAEENDYALWLRLTEKANCYLLDENLAMLRTKRKWFNPFFVEDKFSWRYKVYRKAEGMNPIVSVYWTFVNSYNGLMKKIKYRERAK